MIEINLLPGATRRAGRRRPKLGLSLPRLGSSLPGFDRSGLLIAVAWIGGLGLVAWLFLGARARKAELEAAIERAVQDSARYAVVIERVQRLRARQDTILQKLEIIQEIDAGRYVWAHILDEIGRILPDYTWLTEIAQIEPGPPPVFRVQGRTGNTFALTEFMRDLEASPFIRNVRLSSTELVQEQDNLVHAFVLEATYEEPPADMIETVPLFGMKEE